MPLTRLLPIAALAALVSPTAAQTTKLIATGDLVPGLGIVRSVREFEVNAAGDWIATVHYDAFAPSAQEVALVRNGVVVLKPGDSVPGYPPGATFAVATGIRLDAAGHFGWIGHSLGSSHGVYRGLVPHLLEGDPIVGTGIAPGTVCTSVADYVFEPGGTMLVNARMNDANFPWPIDHSFARVEPSGTGFTATAILNSGDQLPGTASVVHFLASAPNTMAGNSSGQLIFGAQFFTATIQGIYLDTTPLALTGNASPVAGANWDILFDRPVALNDAGDYAFSGILDAPSASNYLLVRNDVAVAREGETLPAIAPHVLTAISGSTQTTVAAPIRLTQDGRVLWYGAWSDPDTTRNSGLFLDHELVVQEGVTHVGGVPIDEFAGDFGFAEFDVSPDGESIYVRALLANGNVSAFVLRPAGGVQSISGCVTNAGLLSATQPPTLGDPFSAEMSSAQASGAIALLFVSTKPVAAPAPCGLAIPGLGEVLIDFVAPNPILTRLGASPSGPAPTPVHVGPVPDSPALSGASVYAQGVWFDLAGAAPGEFLRLTNALKLSIGL